MILDTDFLIPLLHHDQNAIQFLEELVKTNSPVFITHINLWELYQGAYKSKRVADNLADIEKLINNFEILPFTPEIDRCFAELLTRLEKEGNPIGVMDTLMASFALEQNDAIVTKNIEHFVPTKARIHSW